jgi:N-methylhydantoinase B
MEIESAEAMPFAIATTYDRIDHPPRGARGGGNGAAGRVRTASGRVLSGKGHHSIAASDRLIVEMPGGAGYGDPAGRDPARIARDLRDGLVSPEAARAAYGVG